MSGAHRARNVWAALALCGLALWLALWRSPTAETDDSELIREGGVSVEQAADVARLQYEGRGLTATLTRRDAGEGAASWWAETTRRQDENTAPIHQSFQVDSTHGAQLDAALSPLRTTRRWPRPAEVERDGFGLVASRDRLRLTRQDGATLTFTLGKRGYGHEQVYAALEDQSVVLLDGELVQSVRFADTALMTRRLTALEPDAVAAASITWGGRTLSLTRHNLDEPLLRYWGFSERTGRSRVAGRWMERLMRLKPQDGVRRAEAAPTARRLRITLVGRAGEREQLELVERVPGELYTARSAWLGSEATLYGAVAAPLFKEADALFTASRDEALLAPPRHEPGDGHGH